MLFKNTLAQSSTVLAGYVFSILLAPLLLSRLGLSQFGVWSVTGALAVYAGLVDFGISRAVGRHIAYYDALGDEHSIRQVFTLGLLATLAITIVTFVFAYFAAPAAVDALGVLDVGEMRTVLLCSAAILALQTLRRVFNAVGIGLRKMVAPNVTNVIGNVVNFTFSVGALLMSTDLVFYALANVVADTIGIGISFLAVRHVWKSRLLAMPSRERFKELLDYGMKTQLHFMSHMANMQTDKIILAFAVDVRAAGAFELATRVVFAVKSIGYLAVSALVPTATAEIATRGREVIEPLYRRYTRLSLGVAAPFFVVTCLTAPALLVLWLGEVPWQTSVIVVLLTLAWFVNAGNETGMNLAAADGRPGAMAGNTAAMAGMHIVFALALVPFFGLWGVVAGAALSILIATVLFVQRFHRYYQIPIGEYLAAVSQPIAVSLLPAIPLALIYFATGLSFDGRLEAATVAIPLGAVYGLTYWVLASRANLLPDRLTLRLPGQRTKTPTPA
jgi:O-antigen/teichoic acid export membrane protein